MTHTNKSNSSGEEPERPGEHDDERRPSLLAEAIHFLAHEKKWWLLPIMLMLLLLGLVALLASPGVGPFIYRQF